MPRYLYSALAVRLVLLLTVVSVMACSPMTVGSVLAAEGIAAPDDFATAWAVHASSGRVFASLRDSNQVVEFALSGDEVQRFTVGMDPTEMLLKQDKLIVACIKSPALHVIDLVRNEVIGAVGIGGQGPRAIFCSTVADHLVYCIANSSDSSNGGDVFQVDIGQLKIRKSVAMRGWSQSTPLHVAMSRDGKWIVPDARGRVSPSGADLMKVDDEDLSFAQLQHHHASFGPISAGPLNRFWMLGNILYSHDLQKVVRKFAGPHSVQHPELDLVVSLSDKSVVLERFSDAVPIKTVPIPPVPPQQQQRTSQLTSSGRQALLRFENTLAFDLRQNRVFVGMATHGFWIDLDDVKVRLKPLMMVQVPTETQVLADSPLIVPLGLTPGSVGKTKLRIASGPESASIDENAFVWKPGVGDVGIQPVRVELVADADGAVLDAAEFTVRVTLPVVDLGFQIRSMERSPDGKRLLVWGPASGQESRHPAHSGPDECVLLDLEQMEVISRETMSAGIRLATLSDQHVFIAPTSGNLIIRYDDSFDSTGRQFLPDAPTQMTMTAADRLTVVARVPLEFDTEVMQPVADHVSDGVDIRTLLPIVRQSDRELRLGERVLDLETGKTLHLVNAMLLPQLCDVAGNFPIDQSVSGSGLPEWGRRLKGSSLTNQRGSVIATLSPGQQTALLSELPAAVVVQTVNQGSSQQTVLEVCSLVDGAVKHSAVIDVVPFNRNAPRRTYYGPRAAVLTSGSRILVANEQRLIAATIPDDVIKSLATPAHFGVEQPTELPVSGEGDGPATITLQTAGSREGIRFSLLRERPGIALDEDSGDLQVDTRQLWSSFVERFAPPGSVSIRSGQKDPFDREVNAAAYKQLTGKTLPANRLATALSIAAALRDSEGQEDLIEFTMVVTGPRSEFDTERARIVAENEKRKAEQIAERERLMQARAAAAQGGDAALNRRLDELEARIRRIEVALDAVLTRLEAADKNASKASK